MIMAESWLSESKILLGLCVALSASTVWVFKLVKLRREYRKLHGSLSYPPFNPIIGSIVTMIDVINITPKDVNFNALCTTIYRKFNLGALFVLDTYPVTSFRQMIINDPILAAQVTQTTSFAKHPVIKTVLSSLTGPRSMFFAEGEEFKYIHKMFAPGFALQHLLTLVPILVDDTKVFIDVLSKHAESQDMFSMADAAADLTMDIIGHIVLDHDFNAQTTENEFVAAYRKAIEWKTEVGKVHPFSNPLQPVMQWKYARKMDNYIIDVIDKRYKSNEPILATRGKPAIDLALEGYRAQHDSEPKASREPNADFKSFVVDQMKTFVVAGHETTASGISFIYYLLQRHPEALDRVRKEFDDVLGSSAAEALRAKPHLLNQLPYTLAVIKETLRLYPLAATSRAGAGPITLNGNTYPTEGFLVCVNNFNMHRRADLFPQPDEFIPERFLPAPNNYQDIPKDAYRPFEKGPRACFGQELAVLELKLIMALTLREFDFLERYEEWDRNLGRENPGQTVDPQRAMFGHRAYLANTVGGFPADGMPMKVRKRG